MENRRTFLDFSGFRSGQEKIAQWQGYAKEIVENLKLGNVGLIGDTGTGKTIMAFLVIKALGLRTLFLAPTVILTKQHADLYKDMDGGDVETINGNIAEKKRNWKSDFVVATPHVFLSDYAKGLVNPNDFDFIIFDEGHKAEGDYPYVPVAKLFCDDSKYVLSMSASPGVSPQDIKWAEKVYGIKSWVTAEIEMPKKTERVVRIKSSPELKRASRLLAEIQSESLREINSLMIEARSNKIMNLQRPSPWLTQDEIKDLSIVVDELPKPIFYKGKKELAKIYKTSYLYRLLISENYFSFTDRVEKVLAKDKAKSAQALRSDERMKEVYWLIKGAKGLHPKEIELIKLAQEYRWREKRMLVFSNNKRSASYLKNQLNQAGYAADTLFGGQGKSDKKQQEVINNFKEGKIKIIIATSVVEEGLSLPEVNLVVHYSQPQTEIQRLQRGGRTGRFNDGNVCFLVMEDSFEKFLNFATKSQVKKMKKTFYPSERRKERNKKIQKSKLIDQKNGQMRITFPGEQAF